MKMKNYTYALALNFCLWALSDPSTAGFECPDDIVTADHWAPGKYLLRKEIEYKGHAFSWDGMVDISGDNTPSLPAKFIRREPSGVVYKVLDNEVLVELRYITPPVGPDYLEPKQVEELLTKLHQKQPANLTAGNLTWELEDSSRLPPLEPQEGAARGKIFSFVQNDGKLVTKYKIKYKNESDSFASLTLRSAKAITYPEIEELLQ